MIDSGATDNLLTPTLAQRLGLKVQKLQIPKPILTVDGSLHKQGKITDYVNLNLRLGQQTHCQKFYIATLGQDRVILGYPFLQRFNPDINWKDGTIKGAQNVQIEPTSGEATIIQILHLQEQARKQCRELTEGESLYCTIRRVSFAQQWAAAVDKKEDRMTVAQVPEEYQQHWRVFDEDCVKWFPPSQVENMKIKLMPNAPTKLDCKIYPLNQRELETLCKYLLEELEKGFIEDRNSAYTSPTFYILKKDKGKYRLVVDY